MRAGDGNLSGMEDADLKHSYGSTDPRASTDSHVTWPRAPTLIVLYMVVQPQSTRSPIRKLYSRFSL